MKSEAEAAAQACPVNSFNEWDPLEEVIVGRLDGSVLPDGHVSVTSTMPQGITKSLKFSSISSLAFSELSPEFFYKMFTLLSSKAFRH